jgi:nicotinamide mononucleotide transporter
LHKWIPFGLVEVFGFVTGAICVMLTVEESIWNWPIGLANNVFFVVLFADQRLYADMGLQIVYIVLGIIGWYLWLHGGENRGKLKVRTSGLLELVILAVIGVGATIGMTFFLKSVNDSAPFLDALTTVLSLIAQYLLTRKAIENWYLWMTADVIYVGLYVYKHLMLTAILYALFFAMCVGGLKLRLKSRKKVEESTEVPILLGNTGLIESDDL